MRSDEQTRDDGARRILARHLLGGSLLSHLEATKPKLGWRALVGCAQAMGLLVVFSLSVLLGTILHLNLPQERVALARLASKIASDEIRGTIRVGSVARVLPTGLHLRDVRAYAPDGSEVVAVSELRVRVRPLPLLAKLILNDGNLTIVLEHVRVESARVAIVENLETQLPYIAEAFTPVPRKSSPKGATHTLIRIYLPAIEIGKTEARLRLRGVPDLDGTLSRIHASLTADATGAAIEVSRFGVQVSEASGLTARGTGHFRMRTPDRIWTSFDGHIGRIQVGARFGLRGRHIALSAEVPHAHPNALRALWESCPLTVPLSANISLMGDLPHLIAKGEVSLAEAGTFSMNGPIDIDRSRAEFSIRTKDLSLAALHEKAPDILVTSEGGVTVQHPANDWIADASLKTVPTLWDSEPVPSIDTVAHLERGRVFGTALVNEVGAPIRMAYDLTPEKPLHIEASFPWFRLSALPRIHRRTPTDGWARGDIEVDVDSDQLSATADIELRALRVAGLSLEHTNLDVQVDGPPATPSQWHVTSRWDTAEAQYAPLSFKRGTLTTAGPLLQPKFALSLIDGRGASIAASGTLDAELTLAVRNVEIGVERGENTLAAKVGELRFGEEDIRLTHLSIEQKDGNLSGDAVLGKRRISLNLHARALDLERTAAILGFPTNFLTGIIEFDSTLEMAEAGQQQGKLRLRVRDAAFRGSSALTAALDATLNGEAFEGSASGQLEGFGLVNGHWSTALPGEISNVKTWHDATGNATFEFNYVQLTALGKLLAPDYSISHTGGQAYFQVRLERESATDLPTVMFIGASSGLQLDIDHPEGGEPAPPGAGGTPSAGTAALAPPTSSSDSSASVNAAVAPDVDEPTEPIKREAKPSNSTIAVRGLDFQFGGGFDGASKRLQASLRISDSGQQWVSASGSATLPLSVEGFPESSKWTQLAAAPFDCVIVVHDRPVAELPSWFPWAIPAEKLGGKLALNGTLMAPIATAQLEVARLQMPGSVRAQPVDLDIRATYELLGGHLYGHATAIAAGRRVGLLDLRSEPDAEAAAAGGSAIRHTEAHLALDGLPLAFMAPLAEADIAGNMYGTLSLERSSANTLLAANVKLQDLAIDLLPLGDARLTVRSDGRVVNGRIRFAQGSGSLEARAIAPVIWDGGIPTLSRDKEVTIAIDAEKYDAVILKPLVGNMFSELRGDVNADVSIVLQPTIADTQESVPWKGSIQGTASLRNGVVQARSLGLELTDVEFDATARPQRSLTSIEIRGVSARARSKKPNLRGEGIIFLKGFDFLRATASMSLTNFPLVLEGVSRATATGGVNLQVESERDRVSMVVSIPDLTAVLPRRTGRNVLDLSVPESIRVLQALEEPSKVRRDNALPWQIRVELGDRVRVTRSDFSVPFTGTPVVNLADTLSVAGDLQFLTGGRAQMLGKVFRIESGRIRFNTGEPGNPSMDITAVWTGPLHLVTVRLTGTVNNAKMTLTSDPPLPENEVVALLLGGTPGDGGSATATGVGVGATLWNDVFADTALGAVDIRASNEEERANYTAAVRVSDDVWFEATYLSPATNSQSTPGASGSDPGFSGTLDWRFRRDWSLRTDVGTLGAGFDLLWQYRY